VIFLAGVILIILIQRRVYQDEAILPNVLFLELMYVETRAFGEMAAVMDDVHLTQTKWKYSELFSSLREMAAMI